MAVGDETREQPHLVLLVDEGPFRRVSRISLVELLQMILSTGRGLYVDQPVTAHLWFDPQV